jgi:small subunit ribosomal protein S8
MSLTDPVADMLTRIRNACSAGHRRVDMPVSKLKSEVARLLRDNHYIADFKVRRPRSATTVPQVPR